MVLGKVRFLYLLSTIYFLPSTYTAATHQYSFDDIFFENDFSKAYKAAAKIFYMVQTMRASGGQANIEFLLAKIFNFALKDFFYLMRNTYQCRRVSERDIAYLVQLHERILRDIQHLPCSAKLVAVHHLLTKCNKLLISQCAVKRCNQYQD